MIAIDDQLKELIIIPGADKETTNQMKSMLNERNDNHKEIILRSSNRCPQTHLTFGIEMMVMINLISSLIKLQLFNTIS